MDTPRGGIVPRSQYEALEAKGISTPLRSKPTYPEYMKSTLMLFWDIISFKQNFDAYLSLAELDAYVRLFDEDIHSYTLRLICQMDKIYTDKIVTILRENHG